ncbi:MAG: hypothetical protein AAB425_01975 [Bdellovibrionota bacterium]
MKNLWRGIFQILFLVLFTGLLIRFFPLAIRVSEMAALGLREFWWVVLGLALAGWLVFVLRKRNSG